MITVHESAIECERAFIHVARVGLSQALYIIVTTFIHIHILLEYNNYV